MVQQHKRRKRRNRPALDPKNRLEKIIKKIIERQEKEIIRRSSPKRTSRINLQLIIMVPPLQRIRVILRQRQEKPDHYDETYDYKNQVDF